MTKKNETLAPDEIHTARTGRRSAMIAIGAIAVAATAQACATGCTDHDTGAGADPGNAGTHCTPTGCSDTDSGSTRDPAGAGRRC